MGDFPQGFPNPLTKISFGIYWGPLGGIGSVGEIGRPNLRGKVGTKVPLGQHLGNPRLGINFGKLPHFYPMCVCLELNPVGKALVIWPGFLPRVGHVHGFGRFWFLGGLFLGGKTLGQGTPLFGALLRIRSSPFVTSCFESVGTLFYFGPLVFWDTLLPFCGLGTSLLWVYLGAPFCVNVSDCLPGFFDFGPSPQV